VSDAYLRHCCRLDDAQVAGSAERRLNAEANARMWAEPWTFDGMFDDLYIAAGAAVAGAGVGAYASSYYTESTLLRVLGGLAGAFVGGNVAAVITMPESTRILQPFRQEPARPALQPAPQTIAKWADRRAGQPDPRDLNAVYPGWHRVNAGGRVSWSRDSV